MRAKGAEVLHRSLSFRYRWKGYKGWPSPSSNSRIRFFQELVDDAVRLCGADSAGISIEREGKTDEHYHQWNATAGEYSSFLDASLPKVPSACTVCLERGGSQLFRISKRFFDILGIDASLVTDGILLPWEVAEMRGTIFIISHSREKAFDSEDLN